jgi:hypothetical protein
VVAGSDINGMAWRGRTTRRGLLDGFLLKHGGNGVDTLLVGEKEGGVSGGGHAPGASGGGGGCGTVHRRE